VFSVVFAAYLLWLERSRLRAVFAAVPEMRPAFIGLGVLGVVGYLANDSGAAIPAVVASIGALVMVLLLIEHGGRAPTPRPTFRWDQRAASTASVTRAVSSQE